MPCPVLHRIAFPVVSKVCKEFVDYTHVPLLTRSAEWRFARTMFLMSLVRSTFRQGY